MREGCSPSLNPPRQDYAVLHPQDFILIFLIKLFFSKKSLRGSRGEEPLVAVRRRRNSRRRLTNGRSARGESEGLPNWHPSPLSYGHLPTPWGATLQERASPTSQRQQSLPRRLYAPTNWHNPLPTGRGISLFCRLQAAGKAFQGERRGTFLQKSAPLPKTVHRTVFGIHP